MNLEDKMALIDCKKCGHKISDSAKICPHCKAEVHPPFPLFSLFEDYENLLFFEFYVENFSFITNR